MDSARWHRIQTLFHETADLPEHQRRTFLKDACSGDDALMADVLAMLEEDSRGASLLDGDVAEGTGRRNRAITAASGAGGGSRPPDRPHSRVRASVVDL